MVVAAAILLWGNATASEPEASPCHHQLQPEVSYTHKLENITQKCAADTLAKQQLKSPHTAPNLALLTKTHQALRFQSSPGARRETLKKVCPSGRSEWV